ncbi:MAG TPA: cyclic pyranopterin monophosphate synthase MoaC [Tepidisphaeraceae bacterium]
MSSDLATTRAAELTHIDEQGRARMVDVGHKPITQRTAVAVGCVRMRPTTLEAIATNRIGKGEVLAVARVAGIMGAKRCGDLIPLCHPLALDSVEIEFDLPELSPPDDEAVELVIRATARITARTGVEMEALTAVSVAALTVYDMCKAIDKTMVIDAVRLVSKTK